LYYRLTISAILTEIFNLSFRRVKLYSKIIFASDGPVLKKEFDVRITQEEDEGSDQEQKKLKVKPPVKKDILVLKPSPRKKASLNKKVPSPKVTSSKVATPKNSVAKSPKSEKKSPLQQSHQEKQNKGSSRMSLLKTSFNGSRERIEIDYNAIHEERQKEVLVRVFNKYSIVCMYSYFLIW